MEPVEIQAVQEELSASGGYRIVHTSPGLELGIYVLVAPEPDRQQPHDPTRSTSSSTDAARSGSRATPSS
jgi:hypothetical protein